MAVTAPLTATRRRVIYGLNVSANVVLACALAAFVIWGASRVGGRLDLTREGLNSLSERTVRLLRRLESPITITGLYSTALEEIRPYAQKHQKLVADLLDLYETAGRGKVTTHLIDPSKEPTRVSELLARLTGKPAYRDEATPHTEVLAAFPELHAKIAELMQSELGELNRLRGADPAAGEVRELATLERFFQTIAREAQATEADVKALQNEEIPRYGAAVETVTDYLRTARKMLEEARDWMTGRGTALEGLSAELRQFLAGARERYQQVLADIGQLLEKADKLEEVKLEELYAKLKRGQTVLVETEQEALVLTHDEVFPWRTDRTAPAPPDGDPRDFAGEQAISSAILKLTQKERTAVIFTRYGGEPLLEPAPPTGPMMQMPRAPYGILKELLEKENFITAEWDVKTQDDPPTVADAARVIYVVFPPHAPEQPNPMRPVPQQRITPDQKQRIFDAVRKSGMAVFLTGWSPSSTPFLTIPEKYEFNDYLKSNWGIEVRDTHLVLEFAPHPHREGLWYLPRRGPLVTSGVFHFTDQPIGKPLRGLAAAFYAAAPLRLLTGEEKPAGVTLTPIVELDDTEDVWAIKDVNRINEDFRRQQGTRPYDDDVRGPFPLAVAARSEEGQKLVVLASEPFVSDDVLSMSQLVMVGGALRLAPLYPANADLFINALHWLTDNADRIAVGPRRAAVPRLEGLKDEGTLTFTRVFLAGIWPGLALLAGVTVWLLRRR